jgi:hypothetical protein
VVTCSRWGHLAADGAVLGRRGSRRRCSPRAVPLWLLAAGHLLAAVAGSALGACLALGSRLPPPGTCGAGDLSCRRCSPRTAPSRATAGRSSIASSRSTQCNPTRVLHRRQGTDSKEGIGSRAFACFVQIVW